jgi:hypothetical protein
MNQNKGLERVLKEDFKLHGARLNFISRFVMAVIVVRTVSLACIASSLNPSVFPESNEKRLKRFFKQISLDKMSFVGLMLSLLPHQESYVLSLDRTNWALGGVEINILMLAVCYKGIAFPLLWQRLDKKGNSNTRERLNLLDALLKLLPAHKIEALVADREFIGKAWFKGLKKRELTFVMRLRNNTRIGSKGSNKPAGKRYGYLAKGQSYVCPKGVWIYGLRLHLAVTKSQAGELVVLACTDKAERALVRYAQRWNIECLFSALKTRGFKLESTRLSTTDKLDSLIIMLSIAFAWAQLMGEWVYQHRPLKLKNHGYLPVSFFKRGLAYLTTAILATPDKPARLPLSNCLQLLSP